MNIKVGRRKIFWFCPFTFLAIQVQLVVFVSAFVMVTSLVSFCSLFFYSWCPPCPAICKSGGTCPHALWSRRHCLHLFTQSDDWRTAWFVIAVKSRRFLFESFFRERQLNIFRLTWCSCYHVIPKDVDVPERTQDTKRLYSFICFFYIYWYRLLWSRTRLSAYSIVKIE